MNICIICGIFPPDIGGPATYVPWLAGELLQLGHEVQVICLADDPKLPSSYPFPVTRLRRRMSLPVRTAKTVMEINRLSKKADFLYINGLELEARLVGYRLRKPMVHKIVGDGAWERAQRWGLWADGIDEFQNKAKSLRLRLLKSLRSYPLKSATRIIVPSAYLAGLVQGWGIPEDIISIIPNPAWIPEKLSGLDAELPRPTLVTAGRLI